MTSWTSGTPATANTTTEQAAMDQATETEKVDIGIGVLLAGVAAAVGVGAVVIDLAFKRFKRYNKGW